MSGAIILGIIACMFTMMAGLCEDYKPARTAGQVAWFIMLILLTVHVLIAGCTA